MKQLLFLLLLLLTACVPIEPIAVVPLQSQGNVTRTDNISNCETSSICQVLEATDLGVNVTTYHRVQYYDTGVYPNFNITPGDVLTTNITLICTKGYTATVRDVPESLKNKVYESYGILSRKPYEYEIDHLISLELGGSNDISNLWPEPYNITLGARKKDVVENYLHDQVCNHGMDITFAQQQIVSNWTEIYMELKQ